MEDFSGIYLIKNNINEIVYVGRAVNIRKRWNIHKHLLRRKKHGNNLLQRSWNKYGEENFSFIILEKLEKIEDVLKEREQYYIFKYKSFNREFGFNISPNARSNLGVKHKKETIDKIRNSNIGLKRSDETKRKISSFLTGRKQSSITIEKRRIKLLGKKRSKKQINNLVKSLNNFYGTPILYAFGKGKTLSQWAIEYNINRATLSNRLKRGNMQLEEALLIKNIRGARRDLY